MIPARWLFPYIVAGSGLAIVAFMALVVEASFAPIAFVGLVTVLVVLPVMPLGRRDE